MTKKGSKKTKTAMKAAAKKKPSQTTIPGTERLDANEEIETQAEKYQSAKESLADADEEAKTEQNVLTELLLKHGLDSYVYVDAEGVKREVYIPSEAKAKIRKVKPAGEATDAE